MPCAFGINAMTNYSTLQYYVLNDAKLNKKKKKEKGKRKLVLPYSCHWLNLALKIYIIKLMLENIRDASNYIFLGDHF